MICWVLVQRFIATYRKPTFLGYPRIDNVMEQKALITQKTEMFMAAQRDEGPA